MSARTFVVPDLHGRWALAAGLLDAACVPADPVWRRREKVTVVQLGDLANCVGRDRDADLAILERAQHWFDVVLCGNHEHPYFGGTAFSGFAWFAEVEAAIKRLDWQPCHLIGNTLLTHAGLTPDWNRRTARGADGWLRARWQESRASGPFNRVGRARSGGASWMPACGGVLWSDWSEPRATINQVHGHTPLPDGPGRRDKGDTFAINLDCGGHGDVRRIVGLWLDADGTPGEYVEYEQPDALEVAAAREDARRLAGRRDVA